MSIKYRKIILLTIILFVSIGFAVLTTNLNINTNVLFRDNSWDIHFENVKVLDNSTSINNTVTLNSNNKTSLSFATTLTKPTDYIEFTFYVVNNGTIDAQLNSISTSLTTEEQNYITYNLKYDIDETIVSTNDILYRGQYRKIRAHFEYNYDIEDFYSGQIVSTSLTIKYIQPQNITSTVWKYEYSGTPQTFIAPKTGTYKIELWGASGGSKVYEKKGLGSYTSGKIELQKNNKIYIYLGEEGVSNTNKACPITYNGGGYSLGIQSGFNGSRFWSSGGGATDIRIVNGNWDSFDSLKSRIMVASGGGGAYEATDENRKGGSGGGLKGYDGEWRSTNTSYGRYGTGGTQTTGGYSACLIEDNCRYTKNYLYSLGSFGKGGFRNDTPATGGGSGYFGGGGSGHVQSSGGGSSYISGHIGCVAIEATSTENNITFPTKHDVACTDGTVDIDCSKHYLNYIFTETKMIDGNGKEWIYHDGDTEVSSSTEVVGMPTHDGTGTMTGNNGNGYAKITFIG